MACGGEYCVPTSTNVLAAATLSVGLAGSGLPTNDRPVGERWNFRERDEVEGDLTSWFGEVLFWNRGDPLCVGV